MSKRALDLANRYGRKWTIEEMIEEIQNELENRFVIPAYDPKPSFIITRDENIQLMTWGLVPFWLKPKNSSEEENERIMKEAKKIASGTINARSETLFDKPSYREPIRHHRCLIPSTGYFEFHHEGKNTTPYFIYLKDEEIFSMAGIYSEWYNPQLQQNILTFSQITVPGNEFSNKIHNGGKNPFRMPALLKKEDEERWLNPKLTQQEINDLLLPFDDSKMEAYEVRKDFNRIDQQSKEVIEKI